MSKVYAVYHYYYDRDAERYGEFPCKEDLICCFTSLKKAEEFKKKYECPPHETYEGDDRGVLAIEELPTTYDEKCFWWLDRE